MYTIFHVHFFLAKTRKIADKTLENTKKSPFVKICEKGDFLFFEAVFKTAGKDKLRVSFAVRSASPFHSACGEGAREAKAVR